MKTFRFFWNYFKVYKISFIVVIAMIIIATVAQALFPVFAGQTVTELANLVIAYQNGNPDMVWQSLLGLLMNLAYIFDCARGVESYLYGFDEPYYCRNRQMRCVRDFLASFLA